MFGVLQPPQPGEEHVNLSSLPAPPPNTLTPMPAADFPDRDTLLSAAKEWAANQGFAVVIQRSRFNRMWLKCDRGGNYENRRQITPEQRKRKRGESRLLGCPFKMVASVRKDGTWHVETENGDHNHGASTDLTSHPTLRRMTPAQQDKVAELFDTGHTPAETMEQLRQIWPDIKVLTRDVYNARKKHKTISEAVAETQPPAPPMQDPNGIIPGPDKAGHWAWVPAGEEVTNKRGKRRRKTLPAPPPPSSSSAAAAANMGSPHPQQQQQQQQVNLDPQLHLSSSSPRTVATQLQSAVSLYESQSQSPSHSHQTPAPAAWMSNAQTAPHSTHAQSPESRARGLEKENAILMGRIEKMEREQTEQKEMLAAILGAVKRTGEAGGGAVS